MSPLLLVAVTGAVLVMTMAAIYASATRRRPPNPAVFSGPTVWPCVDIVVPVFNERDFIQAKVANLKQLDYPSDRLRVLLVNGPSSDGTTPLLEEAGSIDEEIHLIQLPRADKTAQLNAALATSTAEWVLVTDADALLPRGILKRLVGVASADPRIGSVGAAVNPEPAHPIEKLHWRMLNALRLRESEAFHATILAGPCYLFRRSLVTSIPDDVVADDAYVALAVARNGQRVACVREEVVETRSPATLAALFWHKERKARACLREVLRFWRQREDMMEVSRRFVVWRLIQLAVAPAVMAVSILAGVAWVLPEVGLAFGALGAIGIAALATASRHNRRTQPLWNAGSLYLLVWLALIVALLRYPWAGLNASLPRVVMLSGEQRQVA